MKDLNSKEKPIGLKQRVKEKDSLRGLEESLKKAPESFDSQKKLLRKKLESLKKTTGSNESAVKELGKKEKLLMERAEKAEKDLLYLRAEFENYKKRTLEEKYHLLRYSGEKFISELATEVLDDLERAFFVSQSQKSIKDLQKGLEMIDKKLKKLFQKHGVEVLDPKGSAFDPSCQEALNFVESSDLPEDQVIETYKKAYKLYDKVIRPAQVVVSKKVEKDSV